MRIKWISIFSMLSLVFPAEVFSQNFLFIPDTTRPGLFARQPERKGILRERLVAVDFERFSKGQEVLFNFFEDKKIHIIPVFVRAVVDEFDPREIWQGRLSRGEAGDAVFFVRKNGISGYVTTKGRQYQIRPLGKGTHVITEVDLDLQEDRCSIH